MRGTVLAMAVVFVATAVVVVPPTGVAQPGASSSSMLDASTLDASNDTTAENATNGTLPPGAILAGALGAQGAEVEGEVRERAFGVEMARAATNESRARVVAGQASDVEATLDDLEERKRTLSREHRAGNISTATYAAEVTELTARTESARRLANRSRSAAEGLPPEIADREGVDVTAIQALERRADELSGPDVSEIARSIAGPDVGRPVAVGPPGDGEAPVNVTVGPPGNESVEDAELSEDEKSSDGASDSRDEESTDATDRASDAVERAEERVDTASERLDDVGVDLENATTVTDAEGELDEARSKLDAARSALSDGDVDDTRRLADEAIDRADRVEDLLDDESGGSDG